MKLRLVCSFLLFAALISARAQDPSPTPTAQKVEPAAPTAPAATPVAAASSAPPPKSGKKSPSKSGPRLKYNAPEASVAAGKPAKSAEPTGIVPKLQALAPDPVGLTIQEYPVLAWFQQRPVKTPVEVTVTEPNKPEPIMSFRLEQSPKVGVSSVSLEAQNVSIAPGTNYTWTVAIVVDPSDRSKDIKSSGSLKRIPPPAGLEQKIAKAAPSEKAILLAGAGLWYDALSVLNAAILAEQRDSSLRDLRASLLKQGGFLEIGAAERP